jgi:hypothetical protein
MRGILNIFSYLLSRLVAFRLGNSTLAAAFFLVLIAPATASLPAFADGPGPSKPEKGASAQRTTSISHEVTERRAALAFEPNAGQDSSDAKFIARSGGYLARLNAHRASLIFPQATKAGDPVAQKTNDSELNLTFKGARAGVVLTGEQPLAGRNDYFPTGNPADWKTNIPTYGRVQYRSLYPGIDLAFYGREGRFEYDVDVAAGANPAAVRIALDGQSDARLNAKGDLLLKTGDREMRFLKPMAYQLAADGTRQPVEAGYRMKASTSSAKQAATVSFVVGKYDHARALVIDPVLVYGEVLANSIAGSQAAIQAIAADSSGIVYLTGSNYPYYFYESGTASYIQKVDPNGNVLFTAQLGTSGYVAPTDIAFDSSGNVYVSGYAYAGYLPTTVNAYQQNAGYTANWNSFLEPVINFA